MDLCGLTPARRRALARYLRARLRVAWPGAAPRIAARKIPSWHAVQTVADAHRRKVQALVFAATNQARHAVTEDELTRALASHGPNAAEPLVTAMVAAMESRFALALQVELLSALIKAGVSAAKAADFAGSLRSAAFRGARTVNFRFDTTNQRAIRWAQTRSSQLIQDISQGARQQIRSVIAAGFRDGVPPRESARRIRELVGLTEEQTLAVQRFRERLENADDESVEAFGGKLHVNVPGGGLDEDDIDLWAGKHADKLLAHRAETIARTETIAAANEGQRELWDQAIDAGWLPEDAKRRWITTPDDRLCPICEEMDDQEVGIREEFETPDGESVTGPPAHPNCRCAQGIV